MIKYVTINSNINTPPSFVQNTYCETTHIARALTKHSRKAPMIPSVVFLGEML
jgi:hypothetical protein